MSERHLMTAETWARTRRQCGVQSSAKSFGVFVQIENRTRHGVYRINRAFAQYEFSQAAKGWRHVMAHGIRDLRRIMREVKARQAS